MSNGNNLLFHIQYEVTKGKFYLSLSSTTSTVASKNLCFHVLHNMKVQHPLLMLCDDDCTFFTFITIENVYHVVHCIMEPNTFFISKQQFHIFQHFFQMLGLFICVRACHWKPPSIFLIVLYEIHLFESECRPLSVRDSGAGHTQVL